MAGSPIPQSFVGVWKRVLLEESGLHDDSTNVYWLQCSGGSFADIRIPASLKLPSSCSSLCAEDLLQLARQKGFWGVFGISPAAADISAIPTTKVYPGPYSSDLIRWTRYSDFQLSSSLPGSLPDEAIYYFESEDRLIESGLHEVYRETWVKQSEGNGQSFHFRNHMESGGINLFICGNIFICIADRNASVKTSFEALIKRAEDSDKLSSFPLAIEYLISAGNKSIAEEILSMGIYYGKIDGKDGRTGRFHIEMSTLPWSIGSDLITTLKTLCAAKGVDESAGTIECWHWAEIVQGEVVAVPSEGAAQAFPELFAV